MENKTVMRKPVKIVIALFIALVVALVPLYIYAHPSVSEASTIQIKGNVQNPLNITLSQLKDLPAVTIQATLTSSGSPQENGAFNYTGVTLSELLTLAQADPNATSVYVQASDAYGATLTIKDAQNQNTIIAYAKNGSTMPDLRNGGEGPLRLVIGTDKFAQRWVKGVVLIEVK